MILAPLCLFLLVLDVAQGACQPCQTTVGGCFFFQCDNSADEEEKRCKAVPRQLNEACEPNAAGAPPGTACTCVMQTGFVTIGGPSLLRCNCVFQQIVRPVTPVPTLAPPAPVTTPLFVTLPKSSTSAKPLTSLTTSSTVATTTTATTTTTETLPTSGSDEATSESASDGSVQIDETRLGASARPTPDWLVPVVVVLALLGVLAVAAGAVVWQKRRPRSVAPAAARTTAASSSTTPVTKASTAVRSERALTAVARVSDLSSRVPATPTPASTSYSTAQPATTAGDGYARPFDPLIV